MIALFFLVILACCQKNEEAVKTAIDSIETNQAHKSTRDAAYYNTQLGLAYLNKDNLIRAKKKLLMAQRYNPKSPDVNTALAYYYQRTGDLSDAKHFYQLALKYAANAGRELNNYGVFLCKEGEYKEAMSYFNRAIQDRQYLNTGSAYENAGLCSLVSKNEHDAIPLFKAALAHDSSRDESLYQLVLLLNKTNHAEDARNYLKKYHQLVENNEKLQHLSENTAS